MGAERFQADGPQFRGARRGGFEGVQFFDQAGVIRVAEVGRHDVMQFRADGFVERFLRGLAGSFLVDQVQYGLGVEAGLPVLMAVEHPFQQAAAIFGRQIHLVTRKAISVGKLNSRTCQGWPSISA